VTALRGLGHDVSWIGNVIRGASDIAVLDLAARERRIILTFDKDFGELERKSKLPDECGVILFRVPVPGARR
jgi:predicted nuclease of predicted toxin-antitoxin system